MRLTPPLARGDIVLAAFPFSDLSLTKRRPAVVINTDFALSEFTLAFVTSQRIGLALSDEVLLLPSHPEFLLTGLSVPSKIRASKLVTLASSLLTRRLGRLGPLLTAEFDGALLAALGLSPSAS